MKLWTVLVAFLLAVAPVGAQEVLIPLVKSDKADFRVVRLAKGLDSPWGLAFLPDGTLLGTLLTGKLFTFRDGKVSTFAFNLKVVDRGQGGLLDVALSPEFATTSEVYLTYSLGGTKGNSTALARGRWTGSGLQDLATLWSGQPPTSTTHHYGSRLAFGPDGLLYLSLGERGEQNRAQNLADPAGKVLRLTPDGRPAPGNPFATDARAHPGVFTWGHRNPQGLTFRPGTSELWLSEHGPKGGDEINLLKAGANYGWPLVTFGVNYNGTPVSPDTQRPGLEAPKTFWVPSIAPSGLAFYTGTKLPSWTGNLFSGSLAGQELRRMELTGQTITAQETLLKNRVGRIRDVESGPDGYLYLVTDEGDLLRLEPTPD